jgi:carbamoyltransferase
MKSPFWGPDYKSEEYKKALTAANLNFREMSEGELLETVSKAIADGQVIGWFQGRTEWGPRALGNRSILANPARLDMKDILNLKIKRRESFRPFAPSVLTDRAGEYFERTEPVPFMEKVYLIKENQRAKIPAVTHLDGTGRLQTVTKEMNYLYYQLIKKVGEQTGVPMVLNTSFNENEPIVNRPEEAINCFLRTKMDMLVLGNLLVTR